MLDKLFSSVGEKIKMIVRILFVVGCVFCVLIALICWGNADDKSMILMGFLVLLGGPLLLWIESCFVYAFGELVHKTSQIADGQRMNYPTNQIGNGPNLNFNLKTKETLE